MGEFFRKALISYKHAHAMPKTGAVDSWLLDQVPVTYTTYTIKEDDLKFVGPLPSEHAEQAKLKLLPYTSLLEFVAERYHSAEAFIQKLNPGKNWDHLQPGEILKVPNVLPFEIEKITEAKFQPNPAFAEAQDLCRHQGAAARGFRQRSVGLRVSRSRPDRPRLPAPVGTWKIIGVATCPWFRYDEGMLNYGVRTESSTIFRRDRTISLVFSGWA